MRRGMEGRTTKKYKDNNKMNVMATATIDHPWDDFDGRRNGRI